jgi:protein PhnA
MLGALLAFSPHLAFSRKARLPGSRDYFVSLFRSSRDFDAAAGWRRVAGAAITSDAQREASCVGGNRKQYGRAIMIVKDANGATLADGDNVTLIKDLKVKGSSITLKRGALVKNIRLTDNEDEIECRSDKIKGLVLRTEFVKKA